MTFLINFPLQATVRRARRAALCHTEQRGNLGPPWVWRTDPDRSIGQKLPIQTCAG
jgi:hypothetical protein